MQRFVLIHGGQRIVLGDGETVVGRGIHCTIRFNDPAVSREHLRIDVIGTRVEITNLSASNGTLLNGKRIARPHALRDKDDIQIGYRRIRVEVIDDGLPDLPPDLRHTNELDLPVDADQLAQESTRPNPRLRTEEAEDLDEGTRPGDRASQERRAAKGRHAREAPATGPFARLISPSRLSEIQNHTCPRCRAQISFGSDNCDQCGYSWPAGHPSSVTQEIVLEKLTTRRDPRFAVEVPVIYSSATLTVDAMVRDLSRGGMFVATELLDPVGTPCELTALPDGHSALQFSGVVAHVTTDPTLGKGSVGLGIRFVGGTPESLAWLESTVARYADLA